MHPNCNLADVFGRSAAAAANDARAIFVPLARLHSECVARRFAEPLIVLRVVNFTGIGIHHDWLARRGA